jgi:pimeloyl-ACP methyl ester carboxylesterase
MMVRRLLFVVLVGVGACNTMRPDLMRNTQAWPTQEAVNPAVENAGLAAICANGVELHYVDQGRGDSIVFVHGGLVDYREWEAVAAQLSEDYRTIRYSRRYNYPNRNPLSASNHSAAVEGEDLAELIRGLELGPVHLAGISYGGYSALYTALRYPELVRSLTIVEAPLVDWAQDLPGGLDLYEAFMAMWRASAAAFARNDSVAALEAAIEWFVAPGVFERLPAAFIERLMGNIREWRALTTSADAFGVIKPADVQALAVPVLMITGERSYPLFRLVDAEVERQLPDVRRIIVPEGTHDVCSEQPSICSEALREFIAAR